MTKVKIDTAKYLAKLSPTLKKKMRLVGEMLSTEAQRRVKVVTGALKGSIHAEQPADDVIHIVASQEYAAAVELGRPAIKAKSGGWLTFKIKGKWVKVKEVKAAAAQPFLRPAVYENGKKIERLLAL